MTHPTHSPTKVQMVQGAIVVSDPDPMDALLTDNAVQVLTHARDLVGRTDVTAAEMRFTVSALAASLADVLGILDEDVTP